METIRCTRCVMSNEADPTITFDAQGHCNYCTEALSQIGSVYLPDEERIRRRTQDRFSRLEPALDLLLDVVDFIVDIVT